MGRSPGNEKLRLGLKVPFQVGQHVWIKYEKKDIVEKILDGNTVLLKKGGIQGVEQLKTIPNWR